MNFLTFAAKILEERLNALRRKKAGVISLDAPFFQKKKHQFFYGLQASPSVESTFSAEDEYGVGGIILTERNRSTRSKICPSTTSSTPSSTWTGLGSNTAHCVESPENSRRDTA